MDLSLTTVLVSPVGDLCYGLNYTLTGWIPGVRGGGSGRVVDFHSGWEDFL